MNAIFYAMFPFWVIRACDGFSFISERRIHFLTGATGFVGSRVAHDILECDPNSFVVCLVRSKDSAEAAGRLTSAYNKFGLGDNYDPTRIMAIPGDVVESNFGLSQEEFGFWAHSASSMVHCAADIGLSKDSEANGSKTIDNVLEFVERGNLPCSLHFVSSIAAVTQADTDTILESGEYPRSAAFPGGYGEAKYDAETLIKSWTAANPDRPTYIYRAPFIIGCVSQQYTVPDIFFKLIRVLGVLPQPRNYLPLCTINHLSKIMAHAVVYGDDALAKIKHEKGVPKVLHTVAQQQTWAEQRDLIRTALRAYKDTKALFLAELFSLAKAKRTNRQICRSSKKACSPIAVGMLGSVLEHNVPFFDAKSTWEFLSECNLAPSVAKMTERDIQDAFAAATESLEVETFTIEEAPIEIGLTNTSEAFVGY